MEKNLKGLLLCILGIVLAIIAMAASSTSGIVAGIFLFAAVVVTGFAVWPLVAPYVGKINFRLPVRRR